jgi:thiol:disulfide interchange protein DsbG
MSAACSAEPHDVQPAHANDTSLRSKLSPTLLVRTGLSPGIPRRLARAASVKDVTQSPGAPIVYVFTDPQCPYCHRLWEEIRSLHAVPVEFRYVLVGVIAPQSTAQSAAILQSTDPLAALTRHEATLERGGIAPAKAIQPDIREALSVNAALMDAIGIDATPTMIVENRNGEVSLIAGLPSPRDLATILSSVQ